MYKRILSIVIPTRNRQFYAFNCIKAITEYCKDNAYEIIVQDNSDEPSLEKLLKSINTERIRYNYSPGAISFCDNFEKAVELSCGDYLIMIGDDDCILPSIFGLVDFMRKKGIESSVWSLDSVYKWPHLCGTNSGSLTIRKGRPYILLKSTKKAVKSMIDSGNYDYQKFNFPKIYHGVIKRKKLDEAKNKSGFYFSGLTPDIYSAISLSFCIDSILYINYPFSLPGICPRSGAADSLSGKHTGDLKDAPHFRGTINYQWDYEIPYIYSVQSIWAETAIKALKNNGCNFALSKKQYRRFMLNTYYQCPSLKTQILELYNSKYPKTFGSSKFFFETNVLLLKIKRFFKKALQFLVNSLYGRKRFDNVDDIQQAINITIDNFQKYQNIFNKINKLNNEDN